MRETSGIVSPKLSATRRSRCRRPRTQSAGCRPRGAARCDGRVHRRVRLGKVLAGVRDAVRRVPTTLSRIGRTVRPPSDRSGGSARRRLDHGDAACGRPAAAARWRKPDRASGSVNALLDEPRCFRSGCQTRCAPQRQSGSLVKACTDGWRPLRSNPPGRGPLPTWLRHRSSMYRHTSSSLFLALRANGPTARPRGRA